MKHQLGETALMPNNLFLPACITHCTVASTEHFKITATSGTRETRHEKGGHLARTGSITLASVAKEI